MSLCCFNTTSNSTHVSETSDAEIDFDSPEGEIISSQSEELITCGYFELDLIVPHLTSLRELTIDRTIHRLPILPATVRTLRGSFYLQAFDPLALPADLQVLDICQYTITNDSLPWSLADLPRSMKELLLVVRRVDQPPIENVAVFPLDLTGLPATLEVLHLTDRRKFREELIMDYETKFDYNLVAAHLPRGLRELKVLCLHRSLHWSDLPTSLTSLHIYFAWVGFALGKIPPQIKHLTIPYCAKWYESDLPANLQTLNLNLSSKTIDWSQMPPALKTIRNCRAVSTSSEHMHCEFVDDPALTWL